MNSDSHHLKRPNKWLVTVSISFGTLMGAIDSSIVNVALPHIQGSVGATVQEITWISTGYAVALILLMPLTAFLGRMFGQKRVYMICLALPARRLPRHPGARGGRAPAHGAGHSPADLPAEGAGDGDGALRHGRHDR